MSKRKHQEEHEEHVNHEAWVIPYADLLTLLMVMFLALFAIGNINLAKFRELAEAFRVELGGGSQTVVDAGITNSGDRQGILSGKAPWPVSQIIGDLTGHDERAAGAAALAREQAAAAAQNKEKAQLEQVRETIEKQAAALGLSGSVQFQQDERGLTITIVTDKVLFNAGSAALQSEGLAVLQSLASVLQGLPNQIMIEGHTDNRPINTAQYPSNWELSTARATSVLRYLVDSQGLPAYRVSAAGYADQRPIATNETDEGRAKNRRVEILILANSSPLADPTTGGDSATTTDGTGSADSTASTDVATPTTLFGAGPDTTTLVSMPPTRGSSGVDGAPITGTGPAADTTVASGAQGGASHG